MFRQDKISQRYSPTVRICVVPEGDFDLQRMVSDVRRNALELERLEDGPVEEPFVRAAELAQVLDEILIRGYGDVVLRRCDDGGGVLADGLVVRPVTLLAVGGAILKCRRNVRECWRMYAKCERGGREARRWYGGGEIVRTCVVIHPPHILKRCIPGSSALPHVSHRR